MEQTVYIDLYFLINTSMDLICFFLTSRLLVHKFSPSRCILAAALGGVYACAVLFLPFGGVWGLLLDFAACFFMCAVAVFRRGELRQTAEYSLVFTASSVVLGGLMTVLFSLFNKIGLDKLFAGNGTEGESDGGAVWLFALFAGVSALLSLFGGKIFRRKSSRQYGRVEITFGGAKIIVAAFCDSGNLLREPISAKPCIVVDKECVMPKLPEGVRDILEGKLCGMSNFDGRVRVIPTRTVGGEGLLYALRPERVRLDFGGGFTECDAFVALGEVRGARSDICAIVPAELVFGAA